MIHPSAKKSAAPADGDLIVTAAEPVEAFQTARRLGKAKEEPTTGSMAEIQQRIRARRREQEERQLGMPFDDWSERLRAAPNALLRSALFGVVKRGRRKYVKGMPLPAAGDLSITYTGERLDQADLDIYLQIVHYARLRTVRDVLAFPARRLLREIGRSTGKSDYAWLHDRLVALSACATVIHEGSTGRNLITGSLIRDTGYDPKTGEFMCLLNPYLRVLFDDYTLLDWDDRLALGAKQLAKWLQAFYATHAVPYAMKVSTLRQLCGSEIADPKHFRSDLKKALDELRTRRLIQAWRIDANDLVHVTVSPSPSQTRYLAARARDSSDQSTG